MHKHFSNRTTPKRLSDDPKTPTPAKLPSGRSSVPSKVSASTTTPTATPGRRSSTAFIRSSAQLRQSSEGPSLLTPDIVLSHPARYSCSPHSQPQDQHGRAESTCVSVGVRVRPLSDRERSTSEIRNVVDVVGNVVKVTHDNGTAHSFSYDHCFWSQGETHPQYASQEAVYTTMARPLLEKAYEGYNTCLFAYGQTGSGKSYTMLGEDCLCDSSMELPTTAGVIPRFCQALMDRAHYLHSQNPPKGQLPQCHVEVEVSYIEIYNERIYDLLSNGCNGTERREALRVREHPDTGPYVEGVTQHLVSSFEHLQTWLMLGNKERSIAATGLNDKSSRSHAVFTIRLTQIQVEDVEGEQLESSRVSTINLVDLAGSERVAAIQSQGDRLKEGVCINKSLLTLGKVITALAESEGRRRTFIPYRESVLTYLLKESLGGNSRTAMIATVSPCSAQAEETLSTLRYAQQARKIINHNYVNEDPTAVIIRSLKEEVERLRLQQLKKASSQLFEEEDEADEGDEDMEDSRELALNLREQVIREKEEEKNQAIREKENEIALLQEQLKCQQQLNEKTKSLEQRLQETEQQQKLALESLKRMGITSETESVAVLINLNEDPQLSETLSYRLKGGTTSMGQTGCDLVLSGLHTEGIHCSITNENGCLKIFPRISSDTYVNGKLISSPQVLHHNDRIVLAGIYYFRLSLPGNKDASFSKSKMDFYFTKEELLKEQEIRLRKEAEEIIAKNRAEMEAEMQLQRDRLMQDIQDAQTQLVDKQKLVYELEGTRSKLETEKQLLQDQLTRDRKNAQNRDASIHSPTVMEFNILQEVKAVFDESVLEVRESTSHSSPLLTFKIKEANQICKRLRAPYEFVVQEILRDTKIEVAVLVKDLRHQMTAVITTEEFSDKLQILREAVQNREEGAAVFSGSLLWERSEDVTRVPGFIDRVLDCPSIHSLNTSINFSFSASSALTGLSHSFRKKKAAISSTGVEGLGRSSVCVATAIHQAVESLPALNPQAPPTHTALMVIAQLHQINQHIREHITEPGFALPDEELSRYLVQLLCLSQMGVSSLLSLATSEALSSSTHSTHHSQLLHNLQKSADKITTNCSRLFQGVKTDVESLVEEASGSLRSLAHSLTSEIAQLAIIGDLPLPDIKILQPGGLLLKAFIEGLKIGLDWLVKNAGDTISSTEMLCLPLPASVRLATQQSMSDLSDAGPALKAAIAAFLKKFGKLNATIEWDQNLSQKQQTTRLKRWVNNVASAADTIEELECSCLQVLQQLTLFPKGQTEESHVLKAIKDLKKSLKELMVHAGLSPTTSDGTKNYSLASCSDLDNSQEFMSSLQFAASSALKAIENVKECVSSCTKGRGPQSSNNTIKYNKKTLTHWPTNSREYQHFLKQITQHNVEVKSSLKASSLNSGDEKRVRFDVGSVSYSTSSYMDDSVDL